MARTSQISLLESVPPPSATGAPDSTNRGDALPPASEAGLPSLYDGPLEIGIDVGSTTVKAVVVEPAGRTVLWSDYQRHHTHQAETVLTFLELIAAEFPRVPSEAMRVFLCGSGAGPLAEPLGAVFVQEVNALTMATEWLHPDVSSVVELGGQDAKIIIFKTNEKTGSRQVLTSMNDKCASGTGATIDKCLIKVGLHPEALGSVHFDDSRLHHVAAKCGVFAEMDIVGLVKSGVPPEEILCSLADAIVMQNMSVLTRGNTLRPRVLLLGGPNHYLPFLQECWRIRIAETWAERNIEIPPDLTPESAVFVPERALLYAAYGVVLHGLREPKAVGRFAGLEPLREFIGHGRKAHLTGQTFPALAKDAAELEDFRERYSIPPFVPATFSRGETVRAVLGVDGGSTSTKAVLMDEEGRVLKKEYQLSRGNPIQDVKELLTRLRKYVQGQGATLEIAGFGTTGYAANVLEKTLCADVNVVETVAHMKSAVSLFGETDVICDIGGQDIKVLFLHNGELRNFRLNNQCSAGNGMLLQAMAEQFGVPIDTYAEHAFRAQFTPQFSYGCAVFLDSDRVNFQKEGFSREEMMAGLALVLPKNIWQYVVQIPRMAELGTRYVLQGGTQYNLAAVKSQVDYILQRVPEAHISIHPHPGEAGAIGAAMETLRVLKQRGYSTFIGLDQAIGIEYTTRTDEGTRCSFCKNHCVRTFINTRTPDGGRAQYISGFSCERGTVADIEALKALNRKRRDSLQRFPNLATYESQRLFAHNYDSAPLPSNSDWVETCQVKRTLLGKVKRTPVRRRFRRSSTEAAQQRAGVRIGLPRCLNMWSTAPFWRAYFETLGISSNNLVWSDETTEQMFAEGGKYGSVDPCYPGKVAQSHIHNLLFRKHTPKRPLNYIFFPTITQMPSWLELVSGQEVCPVVAGTPNVMKASFTKEADYFALRGIEYLDNAVSFAEGVLAKHQVFAIWGERLGVSEDESDFAVDQGWRAMAALDADLQERGRALLEEAEQEHRICLLLLARPYHLDRGMNHGVLEDLQALGYPILTLRSIPKDPAWLARFFPEEAGREGARDILTVNDVWPEGNITNSTQKVWGARFAARHPNVAVLDLSSFKCGHDAPTYGIIERIVNSAGTPYSALHDIDANKPAGSIAIRVKTFAYTLKLRSERLEEQARLERRLAERLDARRSELLAAHRPPPEPPQPPVAKPIPTPEAPGCTGDGKTQKPGPLGFPLPEPAQS